MQNRYVGDVGDFGKLGMLRCIENSGIRIGINWYLVDNETHNNDGKHIGYLNAKNFLGLDDTLLVSLNGLLQQNKRSIEHLEKLDLLKSKTYFHKILNPPHKANYNIRSLWHYEGLRTMSGCELIFLDPDNGLIPKSVGLGSKKSIKYILQEEIIDYYRAGHSIAFYSHRTREQLSVYLKRFTTLFNSEVFLNATIKGISFKRGTLRDYFFIIHPQHVERISKGINELLCTPWNKHFSEIPISDIDYY